MNTKINCRNLQAGFRLRKYEVPSLIIGFSASYLDRWRTNVDFPSILEIALMIMQNTKDANA